MLMVIDNPNAPTTYDYKVSVPDGGSIQLTSDGGAQIVDGNGPLIAAVAAPWAHDATGKPIQTYFTTDGMTLTQHVEHKVPGIVYPVTADPWWNTAWKIAKCTAAIAWLIGTSYLGYREVMALGGVAMAARLIVAAASTREIMGYLVGVAGWVLGVQAIRDNCF